VISGLDKFPKIDPEVRDRLNAEYKAKGIEVLQQQLQKLDPSYFEKVDKENPHRLIRALEVCIGSGKPYSYYLGAKKKPRNFETLTIGISAERPLIYDRINRRVDQMMVDGLLAEVQGLMVHRERNALQTVGYKELFQYLEGTWTLDFAISEIKKNTRRFAKRQLTWFRKNEETLWVSYDIAFKDLVSLVERNLSHKKE
ncbi:MAG: tRNA (adenosine(37)-N6)-dimethylallyltransferase MiaA, partial [Pricia sp.]